MESSHSSRVMAHVQRHVLPVARAQGGDVSHLEAAISAHSHPARESFERELLGGHTTVGDLLARIRLGGGELDNLAAGSAAVAPERLSAAVAAVREEVAELCAFFALAAREFVVSGLSHGHCSAPQSRGPCAFGSMAQSPHDSFMSGGGSAGDTESMASSMSSCGDLPEDLMWCLPLGIAHVDGTELSACYGAPDDTAPTASPHQPPPSTFVKTEQLADSSDGDTASRRKRRPSQRKKTAGGSSASRHHRLKESSAAAAVSTSSGVKKVLAERNSAGKMKTTPKSPRRTHRHQCPHCDKLLDTKYKLERHVRTHTGEKPFKCEVCTARFNQKSSLKTHSTIHARAVLRDPSTTKATIESYTINGHNFDDLGIPYAGFVYDAIHKQRSAVAHV